MSAAQTSRVAAYVRVSTDAQAESGYGLQVQEAAIRAWTKEHGFRLAGVFADAGISGSNGLDTRIGLADAIAEVRSGRAAGIVVYRLDRLARDLVLQETLLAELRRMGGQLYSTSAAEAAYLVEDPDDPSRRLIRQVLGAVAEFEKSMIALRLRSGRRRKAQSGGFAFGSPPFGSAAHERALVPDERERQVVERMCQLRAEGASLRQIAATLNDEGVEPKRAGSRWHPTTVARVLARS